MLARLVFFIFILFVTLAPFWWPGVASPALALALGVVFGLSFTHPYEKFARSTSKLLLQISVVGLGFGMNLLEVLRAGKSGFIYTFVGIAFALASGKLLGAMLGVRPKSSYLISVGTAICGGSAIAAVGPVIEASDEEMSVSIGTVFILNAVGLLVFPVLGHAFHLSETQFGLWAALAIHDTSSVVGAGAKYGLIALAVATTVKLARALWIVPVTLATAFLRRRKSGDAVDGQLASTSVPWPWFILFFVLAAVLNSYVASGARVYPLLANAARVGLSITLFLIGTGISRGSLKSVGVRPLAQGVALWILVAVVSLALIRAGLVAL